MIPEGRWGGDKLGVSRLCSRLLSVSFLKHAFWAAWITPGDIGTVYAHTQVASSPAHSPWQAEKHVVVWSWCLCGKVVLRGACGVGSREPRMEEPPSAHRWKKTKHLRNRVVGEWAERPPRRARLGLCASWVPSPLATLLWLSCVLQEDWGALIAWWPLSFRFPHGIWGAQGHGGMLETVGIYGGHET